MERTTNNDALRSRETHLQTLFLAGLDGDERAYRVFLSELSSHVRGFASTASTTAGRGGRSAARGVAGRAQQSPYVPNGPTADSMGFCYYSLQTHGFFRGRSRHEVFNDSLDDATDLFAEPVLEPAQASRDLNKLLEQLPDRQRLPIQHVKLEGLSVTETAQVTGLSESAVKIGVHRGLKALARRIIGAR